MQAVTGACMVLAAGSGIVGLVMGLRILCHEGDSRGQTTSAIFFLCGETAAGPQAQGGPGGTQWRRGAGDAEVGARVGRSLERDGRGLFERGGGSRRGKTWDRGRGLGGAYMQSPLPSSPRGWAVPRPAAADRLDRLHGEECVEKRRLLLLVLFFGVAGSTLLISRG